MSQLHVAARDSGAHLAAGNLTIVVVVAVIALLGLVVAVYLRREVLAAAEGTPGMCSIAEAVQEGAAAYLRRQFRTIGVFVGLLFLLLFLLPGAADIRIGRSVFFVIGTVFSGATGYSGMWLAVRANVRVANAAREEDARGAMRIAFRTGGMVGMLTVGLGLFGASAVVLIYKGDAPKVLEGFGFGAALLAMFMRVGGGIFTKAADVGADLVGKVEKGIPEDDPRNAATIADNVGDNVGDCAGMAADLFESYAVTLVAALILGRAAFGSEGLVFPLIVPAIGVLTAVFGVFSTRLRAGETNVLGAINRSFYTTATVSAVGCGIAAFVYLPGSFAKLDGAIASTRDPRIVATIAVILGIALAASVQALTGYFTGTDKKPVQDIGKTTLTGPATVILSGIAVGLESAVYSAILIGAAIYGAFLLGGGSILLSLFAVALAGCGLLTTVGVIVAMDTFGPVSDNAQGIAEMSGDVRGRGAQILTQLDAVGNTTKAITKGIAISTAVLAATALFGAFTDTITTAVAESGAKASVVNKLEYVGILNVGDPKNLIGLLMGAAAVFLFSSLAIQAVARAAGAVVHEVRDQFRRNPGIMDHTQLPEYGRVVDICTRDSLRELATPGLLALMTPIAVGFGLGVGALGCYLAGSIATGMLMAVFLSNSGGAWDNAKKMIEDGLHGGKGSPAHEAAVIGDTVGDPFKDTAGPSINPLIKVMNLVSLLVAPAIVKMFIGTSANTSLRITITAVAAAIVIGAVVNSKRRSIAVTAKEPVAAGSR